MSAAGFWPEMRRWPVSAACWALHNNRLLLRKKEGGRRRGGEEAAFTDSGAEFRQLTEGGGTRRDEPFSSVVEKLRVFVGCL